MKVELRFLIGATYVTLDPDDAVKLYNLLHKALYVGLGRVVTHADPPVPDGPLPPETRAGTMRAMPKQSRR